MHRRPNRCRMGSLLTGGCDAKTLRSWESRALESDDLNRRQVNASLWSCALNNNDTDELRGSHTGYEAHLYTLLSMSAKLEDRCENDPSAAFELTNGIGLYAPQNHPQVAVTVLCEVCLEPNPAAPSQLTVDLATCPCLCPYMPLCENERERLLLCTIFRCCYTAHQLQLQAAVSDVSGRPHVLSGLAPVRQPTAERREDPLILHTNSDVTSTSSQDRGIPTITP